MADFGQTIAGAYAAEGAVVDLGRGVHEGTLVREAAVKLPLRMVNRHGLIAGATGTGKTKTLFKDGKKLEKQVVRGVFGLLKKNL